MIRTRALVKRFGGCEVLKGVDLDIASGERVAILGLNGAGKTTLIRCILGLTSFDGSVSVANCNVDKNGRNARLHMGYVPQRAPHFPGTLSEVIEFFAELRGMDVNKVRKQLDELDLPLAEHGGKQMGALSGGMLQKSLLALALAAEVPVLLLDEPTANLDSRARRDFIESLRAVPAEATIVLATHRLIDVEAVATRLIFLHEGRLAFDGPIHQLWDGLDDRRTLWIKVPPDLREMARRQLSETGDAPHILATATAIGVRVGRSQMSDVLGYLRDAAIPVMDFWIEAPGLTEVMEKLLQTTNRSDAGDPSAQ
ncbi:MAG: ABC transporter ATP-binding protein [Gemmatimonadales bacterium]